MISSYEVNSLQASQIQAIQAQQAYSLAQGQPYGYNGFSGHNLPGGGFNYSGNATGYNTGNSIGQGAVNSAQGVFKGASFAATGLSAAAGYRLGGAGGALRAGLATGGLLGGAGLAFGGHAFSNLSEGAGELASTQQTLGANFQFGNAQSRTGRGFSRSDAKAVSDTIREMGSLPELLSSYAELNGIMGKISQMGVMNNVRNVADFSKKFKETLGTLKEISKVMEVSLTESLKYFEESRRSGLYNPQMMKMNMGQRQFTAGLTGMDQGQIGQLQMAGSQISFGYGGTRGSGAQSALRSARQIGMANEMGLISNDRIAEFTGQEGGAGIAAMAGSLTDASQRMSQG